MYPLRVQNIHGLKPCFYGMCGHEEMEISHPGPNRWQVKCEKCSACGPECRSQEAAKKSWNSIPREFRLNKKGERWNFVLAEGLFGEVERQLNNGIIRIQDAIEQSGLVLERVGVDTEKQGERHLSKITYSIYRPCDWEEFDQPKKRKKR